MIIIVKKKEDRFRGWWTIKCASVHLKKCKKNKKSGESYLIKPNIEGKANDGRTKKDVWADLDVSKATFPAAIDNVARFTHVSKTADETISENSSWSQFFFEMDT